MHVIAAFAAATLALVTIDLLWLGVMARRPGRRGSERTTFKAGVGLAFSGLVAIGLLLLAINPTAPVEAAAPTPSQQRSPAVTAASAPA